MSNSTPYVSQWGMMQMMAQQQHIPLLQFQQYHANCLTWAAERYPGTRRDAQRYLSELWVWNHFFVAGAPFPGMDPMYVDALPSAVQAANPQTTLSAQHSATPGQITALRLEMQNALDKMESELKLKDELLNVLRQNGSMKDVQIKQKDDDIKLKDAEIKQKDDEVRQRDQEIKQGHDKIKGYQTLIEKKSDIIKENEITLTELKTSVQRRDVFIEEKNELFAWRNKRITEKDDIIADREQEIREIRGLLRNKEHNERAKDESKQKLKNELNAKIAAHQSRQRILEREIHDLKTTVFRKNEELVLLQAQVRHRGVTNVISSGSLIRTGSKANFGGRNLGTCLSSNRLSSKIWSNGASLRGVLKEGEADNTGEDAGRFLDRMLMEMGGSNEAGVKAGPAGDVVALQGRKRNLSRDNEELREEAESKRIKQECED